MNQRSNRIAAVGLLVFVLGCGAAIGIAVERLWLGSGTAAVQPSDAQRVARLLERFKKELSLDAAQADKAREVLIRGKSDIATILARQQPELRAARAKTREELTALLTPEQRTRYAAMVQRFDERRAKEAAAAPR